MGFPRPPSWRQLGRSTPRSSRHSTASCDPSRLGSDDLRSVLRQVLAAFEDLLDLTVSLLEAERQFGRHRVDAAVHADRLHALQELDVEEGLRCGGFLEEGLVQGERIQRPFHDLLEFPFREKGGLAQYVDEGQAVAELDRRGQEDGRDEAARRLHYGWVVEIEQGR